VSEAPSPAAPEAEQERIGPDTRLTVRPLSIVPEDDEFLVGDTQSGVFISIPEVGVVALRELEAGATVAEAAETASQFAGQDVNVVEFAGVLVETGFVAAVDGAPMDGGLASKPATWVEGVRPELVRPFFSIPAWSVYGGLLALSGSVFLTHQQYWPSFEDVFFSTNPALCIAVIAATSVLLAACHEACHWLGARAAGVAARFRVSRRLFVPVFETDLSQLWSVPRRQRYAPLLAGMAFDSCVLAVALGVRVAWGEGLVDPPPMLVRFLGAVVLVEVVALGFQTLVFLRTDLYAVLITALGCKNLYRVNFLRLKQAMTRLSPEEQDEMAAAHPRDLAVARWFSLLYLVGFVFAAWYFVKIFFPATVILSAWLFYSLGGAPVGSSGFWQALIIGSVVSIQVLWPLAVFAHERLTRRPAAV
jgi:hypothetical protein